MQCMGESCLAFISKPTYKYIYRLLSKKSGPQPQLTSLSPSPITKTTTTTHPKMHRKGIMPYILEIQKGGIG
jgi:hypothetical protein